ncbi:flagellar motor protein MotA [Aureimonas mangrovi]|uniref:flagellar motor protein MotA n=1 Tax=Aureimonas mangrovi TaxID=2758041 RepID=UPI00163D4D87|nr:flagellar motor protein MotA [Aureimonas mangrovi]
MQVLSSTTEERRPASGAPDRLSSPLVYLWAMLVFLALAGFVAAILGRQVFSAFGTNPGLNGLIIGVLVVGILMALRQILKLRREVRWVNAFRDGAADAERVKPPVLLSPMQALIGGRRGPLALANPSVRSILESVATRLDESRDVARYLIGLLVFLGLLGTFWGLLATIGSISATIETLDPGAGDAATILNSVQTGLSAPLAGMGTAFSSSLFGLAGSMVLGFLDLQVGRAQNRFYTELEDWLSSITDIGSDVAVPVAGRSLAPSGIDEIHLLSERLNRLVQEQGSGQRTSAAMANLAESIQGLVQHMRSEQQMLRDFVESQAGEQRQMRGVLERLSSTLNEPGRR